MPKIEKPEDIRYLAFEGGGGKGVVFLGAIRALEDLGVLPIKIPPKQTSKLGLSGSEPVPGADVLDQIIAGGDSAVQTQRENQVLGISGASAGAITALMLAMGLDSKSIVSELNAQKVYRLRLGQEFVGSVFDSFTDYPEINGEIFPGSHSFRKITLNGGQYEIGKKTELSTKEYISAALIARLGFLSTISQFIKPEDALLKRLVQYYDPNVASPAINPPLFGTPLNLFADSNVKMSAYFLNNLLYQNGVFAGFGAREYFRDLIRRHLLQYAQTPGFDINKLEKGTLSFSEFFELTQVDLVITGTNVTQNRSVFFSKDKTPSFPVVEAVTISMNLPGIFKPIIVEEDGVENYWVDGGMLNNFPIHAFNGKDVQPGDEIAVDSIPYDRANSIPRYPEKYLPLNPALLGFRVTDGYDPNGDNADKNEPLNSSDGLPIVSYAKQLINTFMYASEEGQIRSELEREQVIELFSHDVSVTEFNPPEYKYRLPVSEAECKVRKYFNESANC